MCLVRAEFNVRQNLVYLFIYLFLDLLGLARILNWAQAVIGVFCDG